MIGFPVLDSTPYGLGHSVHHTIHGSEELGVSLPKLGSDDRSAVMGHYKSNGEECYLAGQ